MKVRIFNSDEFRKADKIERLYMYIMQPDDFVLTDAEDKYLNKLKCAFVLLSESRTKAEAYAKFDQIHLVWKSERTIIFQDCQELFGRTERYTPAWIKYVATEHLLFALNIARNGLNVQEIVSTALALGRIYKLDKPVTELEEKIKPPAKVIFNIVETKHDNSNIRHLSQASELPAIDSGE